MQKAESVARIVDRQVYRGGWPLGFTTAPCPAHAPVGCQFISSYNLNCCPRGQFCFGTLQPYCCPTDNDCGAAVKNIPVCANSTWNMFHIEQFANRDYFCCPSGYVGVLPIAGAAGICELDGVNVPRSQLATAASQIGGTSVPPFSGIPTATLTSIKSSTPATTTIGSSVTTIGSSVTTTGYGEQTGSSVPGDGTGTNSSISTGAIVGIAVGAVAVLILAFALVLLYYRRLRKRPSPAIVDHAAQEATAQEYYKSCGETTVKQAGFAESGMQTSGHGYSASAGMSELPTVSRVEMEASARRTGM